MTAHAPIRMNVADFLDWAVAQPRGRFELIDGEVVMMAPERVRHNLVKLAVARALGDAVSRAGLPCVVYTDGVTVVIDEHTAREPDASVQYRVDQDMDSLVLESPLIVVEVISASSERSDTGQKLVEYFSVASIKHYLVIDPIKKAVIHHERHDSGDIRTRILSDGDLNLIPPGMTVPVYQFFGSL